jgi:hypothetical protein
LISPEDYKKIEQASSVLVTSCMKRFGFSYDPTSPTPGRGSNQTAHRYDPTDPAVAASRGYHEGGTTASATPSRAPLSPGMKTVLGHGLGAPSLSGEPSPKTGARYKGVRIPTGGCLGEAQQALTQHGGIIQDDPAAVDINFKDYVRSMSDPRLKAVFSKWSACMKAKGHSYATPRDADNDPRWKSSTASKVEISTAVADVACKRQNNVVGAWFSIESAHEKQDIQANIEHMTRVEKEIAITVENATKATRGSAS